MLFYQEFRYKFKVNILQLKISFQTPSEILQNEEYHTNFNENADHKDTFNNENSKGRSEFSSHKDRSGNFSHNFTSNILSNTSGKFFTLLITFHVRDCRG